MSLFVIAYRCDLSFRIGGRCQVVDQVPGVLRGVAQSICITRHVSTDIVTVRAYAAQSVFCRLHPVHDIVGVALFSSKAVDALSDIAPCVVGESFIQP